MNVLRKMVIRLFKQPQSIFWRKKAILDVAEFIDSSARLSELSTQKMSLIGDHRHHILSNIS